MDKATMMEMEKELIKERNAMRRKVVAYQRCVEQMDEKITTLREQIKEEDK